MAKEQWWPNSENKPKQSGNQMIHYWDETNYRIGCVYIYTDVLFPNKDINAMNFLLLDQVTLSKIKKLIIIFTL